MNRSGDAGFQRRSPSDHSEQAATCLHRHNVWSFKPLPLKNEGRLEANQVHEGRGVTMGATLSRRASPQAQAIGQNWALRAGS